MTSKRNTCTVCGIEAVMLDFTDVDRELLKKNTTTDLTSILQPLFTLFDIYVCPRCGSTSLRAGPQVETMIQEIINDPGGHG